MKLLLDTCAFLWLLVDSKDLSAEARKRVLDTENQVFLSAVSTWEIALKYGLGRLPLPAPPVAYIPAQRRNHGIRFLPIGEPETLHLTKLPELHKDPFDRMLVSQAIVREMTILTPDPLVTQYPAKTLW